MNNHPQQWLTEHGDYLFRYAMQHLRDEEQAADLVQDTLLAAWKGYEDFAGDAAIRTWLTGILKHKIIDFVRQQIRRRELDSQMANDPTSQWFKDDGSWIDAPQPWQSNPESIYSQDQFRNTLERCIERLSEQQSVVFRLRELLGEESQNICKQLELSTTNLHVLLYRARLSLRRCLELNGFGKEKP